MLDLRWVVENRGAVEKAMHDRGDDLLSRPDFGTGVPDPWAEDTRRRALIREVDGLRHRQKEAGRQIAALGRSKDDTSDLKAEMKVVSARVKALESELDDVQRKIEGVLQLFPNLPADDVPVGRDETANREVRRVGDLPAFDFAPQAHWDLGPALGILDFERAAKMSGARFVVSWDAGARLERALAQFMLDLHTEERGYREVLPPYLVTAEALLGAGQLPKFAADLFKTDGARELYLIPTAEVPLVSLHSDEILSADDLPRRYAAWTPCFRSEAGSYGQDVRGLIRQHQFHKVELVKFVAPEDSEAELEALVTDAEEVLRRLELPYRVVVLSTGDMGFNAAKTYDIEVWLPGQERYREISSCSNCTDFQARRAGIRYRPEPKAKPRFVHTLNGSGLAIGRTVIALLENGQRADGSVDLPPVLQPYMGGLTRLESR